MARSKAYKNLTLRTNNATERVNRQIDKKMVRKEHSAIRILKKNEKTKNLYLANCTGISGIPMCIARVKFIIYLMS